MLHLYDLNKVKIKGLNLFKDYCIESVLATGDKTLSFSYPSKSADEIKEECYIRTKKDEFVVKEVSSNGEWKSIKATLNVEDLEGHPFEHFDTTEKTIEQCLNLALAGTDWTIGTCNVTKRRTIRKTNCSSWDIIQQAKKTYLVEIEFDTINKKINIAEKLGNDKGVYFMDSLNLKNLDIQSNSYDFYTRIIAIGKDDLKVTVENFQYSKKKKTLLWKDERYTDLASLTEDANKKLEEISKPYRSYGADIIDLSNTSNKYSILSYGLGDTITLISKDKGIKEKQRIVKIVEYPNEPYKNTCEIANSILSFADVQKEYNDTTETVNNITEDNGTISEGAIKVAVKNLTVDKLDVGSLNAVEIRVGDLEATSATITQLKAVNADITNLNAVKANVGDLTASVGRIGILESSVGDIKTLVNGNLTSNNIQSLMLTSDKVTVANGFIKNAMIENLDVSKIKAGDISTNKFKIKSDNGGIEIVGATQQFKDKNNKIRIQMGQDTQGNFNFILRGEDGTTTLIDHNGIKEKAIANDLIKSNMISENAVGGKQVDYNSFTKEFNADTNTNTLKSSKVLLDTTGQTLEVSFNSLKSNVDNIEIGGRNLLRDTAKLKGSTASYVFCNWVFDDPQFLRGREITISIDIDALNISKSEQDRLGCEFSIMYTDGTYQYLGVWHKVSQGATFKGRKSYTYKINDKPISKVNQLGLFSCLCNGDRRIVEFPKVELGNKATDWTPAVEDVEQKIETNTTALNIQQGKIDTLISNTTIVKDGKTIQLKDSYNSTVATVNSINSTIGKHTSTIDALTGQITGVETKTNEIKRDLDGTKTSVSNATTTANSALSKATEAKQTADGFLQKVSNIETNYATTSAMNSAISQSTNSIKSEVSNSFVSKADATKTYATKSSMTLTENKLRLDFSSSGGYNIFKNSKGKNGALGWSSNGGGIAIENDIDFGTCFKTVMPNGVSGEWYRLKNDTNYVYEGYIYSRGVISGSSVTPLHFWCNSAYSGGQNQCTIIDYRQSVTTINKWTKCYVHFKTASTGDVLFRPFIYTGGSSFELWFTELSLAESAVENRWTPHPDELYSGNTTIDGNGVEITNGALKVTNANSQVVIDGKYNVHKIMTTGIITIEMPVGVTERTYYVEHNLGFMPAHTCYEMLDATRCIALPSMSLANVVGLSGDVLGFSNILRSRADTNKLLFDFIRCESEKNKYVSVKVRYFIYKEVAF